MREIIFRGKRVDNGEWVYGDLVRHYENQRRFIALDQCAFTYVKCEINRLVSERFCEVDPATVGQYTGLHDKNGKEIYEGDIVRYWGGEYCQGFWEYKGTITVDFTDYGGLMMMGEVGFIEVIGNIHENPALLEAKN